MPESFGIFLNLYAYHMFRHGYLLWLDFFFAVIVVGFVSRLTYRSSRLQENSFNKPGNIKLCHILLSLMFIHFKSKHHCLHARSHTRKKINLIRYTTQAYIILPARPWQQLNNQLDNISNVHLKLTGNDVSVTCCTHASSITMLFRVNLIPPKVNLYCELLK